MSSWTEQIEWDDLLDEILYEKCVLIVGPDLIKFDNNQTLFQVLCQQLMLDVKLREHVDYSPEYIFEHEELLQLKPGKGDTSLFRFFRDFYQSRTEFDEPFTKIVQMPFHLIVSLLPDRRLASMFQKLGRTHQFSYYVPTEKLQDVDKPSQDNPLIYNIIGTLEPPETVITFDHLFNYLQGILGTRPLPIQLAKTLKDAKTFLFLGVHFEKWYMQVLLRVFIPRDSANRKISKYSLLQANQANDVSTFIARRLDLDFLSVEPLDFLNELYRRFDQNGLLLTPKKISKATVFVSYSHTDSASALQLAGALKQANITVVMDEESMPAGEKIRQFLERVQEVDAIVAVVSEYSLQSPWVGKEIMYGIKNSIKLVPCYVDKHFLETTVTEEGQNLVRTKLREINRRINERRLTDPLDSVSDLTEEEELWRELGRNLPDLVSEIRGRKCIPLFPTNINANIQQVVSAILS